MLAFATRSLATAGRTLVAAGTLLATLTAQAPDPSTTLWDDRAATQWDVAYPVGNGRLAAMPWGEFPTERILVNEETIWARKPGYEMPADSSAHLEEVRRLEAAGDHAAADQYFQRHLQTGIDPCDYQLVGWLHLQYRDTAELQSTRRSLDLTTGEASSEHLLRDGTTIRQCVVASAPDDVLVVTITASRPITVRVTLDEAKADGLDLLRAGTAGGDGTRFVARVRTLGATGAKVVDDGLELQSTQEATFLLAVASDFHRTDCVGRLPDGWQQRAAATLDRLRERPATSLLTAAADDHRRWFDRVAADFGTTPSAVSSLPTRERLQRLRQQDDDPDLIEAYFQFGRYLLIAASRPGCLPTNLQGKWNPHSQPPWGADYHLNINIQMNYWPAETTNLGELHQPLFDLIRRYQAPGKAMAQRLGMQGWCMGHASDVWGNARIMSSTAFWGGSFFGGQWLTLHVLEHWRFQRDPAFLGKHWDLLTESTAFVLSWLIPGPGAGEWMCRPACSPENSFVYTGADGKDHRAALAAGNTFDQFLVLQVLTDYLEAAAALGKDGEPLVQRVREMLPKVYRPRLGADGRLMEWRQPFRESEPGHRHISHLIGAYPGNRLDLDRDPAVREAVLRTLETRLAAGGAGTGWSRAWTIGMFARLGDAPRAYENLLAILRRSTLDNLFDNHPPFQIDGNFGATAAIAEMLLHSHGDGLRLLPALPTAWPRGKARGLRARGDYTVDLEWRDGEVTAIVHAGPKARSGSLVVRHGARRATPELAPGATVTLRPADFRTTTDGAR